MICRLCINKQFHLTKTGFLYANAEINLVEHQPSVIAAASVLAAYDYQLTKTVVDNKMNIIPLWGTQERVGSSPIFKSVHDTFFSLF